LKEKGKKEGSRPITRETKGGENIKEQTKISRDQGNQGRVKKKNRRTKKASERRRQPVKGGKRK